MWWVPAVSPALLPSPAQPWAGLVPRGSHGLGRKAGAAPGTACLFSVASTCRLLLGSDSWATCVFSSCQGLQHLPRASGLEAGGRGSEATLEGPRIPVVSRCPASPLGIHLYPCRLPADLRRHWQMQKQSLLLTVLPAPTIASGQSPVINPLTVSPGGPASLIKASS